MFLFTLRQYNWYAVTSFDHLCSWDAVLLGVQNPTDSSRDHCPRQDVCKFRNVFLQLIVAVVTKSFFVGRG